MVILIVGEYKTGKSVSAATFPKPMLYLDFDDGVKSIYANGKDGKPLIADSKDIHVERLTKSGSYDLNFMTEMKGATAPTHTKGAPELVKRYNEIIKEVATTNAKGYKTVVIDSLTNVFRCWKEATLSYNNIPALRIPDYGMLEGVLLGQFIPTLKALNVEFVILIDHEDTDKDEITGQISAFPVGPSRNMGKSLGLHFDEIWRQQVQGDKYQWRTRKSGFFQAGSRLNLPDPLDARYDSIKPYIKCN